MNLVRCENGHFYDSERFTTCPHCNQGGVNTVMHDQNGDSVYTVAMDPMASEMTVSIDSGMTQSVAQEVTQVQQQMQPQPQVQQQVPPQQPVQPQPQVQQQSQASGLGQLINDIKEDDDAQKTVGMWGNGFETEPVVGWLVAIEGAHHGEDFRLKTGRNFVGRSANMDVALTSDPSISRDKHAIILYEPKANMFLVQPGDAKELFYLNDKVVLAATEINAYDVLTLGESKLLFIPCCSDKFKWDSVKKEEK